jgi:hypothetical protein
VIHDENAMIRPLQHSAAAQHNAQIEYGDHTATEPHEPAHFRTTPGEPCQRLWQYHFPSQKKRDAEVLIVAGKDDPFRGCVGGYSFA